MEINKVTIHLLFILQPDPRSASRSHNPKSTQHHGPRRRPPHPPLTQRSPQHPALHPRSQAPRAKSGDYSRHSLARLQRHRATKVSTNVNIGSGQSSRRNRATMHGCHRSRQFTPRTSHSRSNTAGCTSGIGTVSKVTRDALGIHWQLRRSNQDI